MSACRARARGTAGSRTPRTSDRPSAGARASRRGPRGERPRAHSTRAAPGAVSARIGPGKTGGAMKTLIVERDERGVVAVQLNRPEKKNSVDYRVLQERVEEIHEIVRS